VKRLDWSPVKDGGRPLWVSKISLSRRDCAAHQKSGVDDPALQKNYDRVSAKVEEKTRDRQEESDEER
jgi:hypothetical protein